jgi:TIR domain
MFVFISYANEQKSIAEEIASCLDAEVFYDRASLPPGKEFHSRIREGVERSDALIFLISPQSVTKGCYALTELKYAREKWPRAEEKVFPVMVERTETASIPGYIRGLTFFEPEGNVAAEVVDAFHDWSANAPEPPKPAEAAGGFAEKLRQILQNAGAQSAPAMPNPAPAPPAGVLEILPGSWQIQVVYPNGMLGQAEAQFFANGMFQVRGSSPLAPVFTINGNWQVMSGNMIVLSGQQMAGYQSFPFTVTITFTQITRTNLAGMMSSGESMTWYRMA